MKKLMIAAAAVAMIGSAFADAQVYEYKLSLKSTTCKEAKAVNSYLTKMGLYIKGDEIVYRTPASLTIKGVSWGCECDEALAGVWGTTENNDNAWHGLTFWNTKNGNFLGGVYNGVEFEWDMLNRIGKKASEVELSFTIVPSGDATDDNFELKLAGAGKITDKIAILLDDEGKPDEVSDCNSYISSVKGSVAGFVNPEAGIIVCNYCEEYEVGCDVYQFCDCGDDLSDDTRTVAYGTFTMKYNSSASKKLRTSAKIASSYSGFPKSVKAALVAANE